MALFLSPICNDQTFDANGDPLNAGEIETYLAGSSTPAATYTDDGGGTPHSNPIILNSLGYPTAGAIWLTGGVSYKFIIKNAAGSTLRTIDDISGINDASVSQSEWVESGFVPTYIGATSFSVPGDQTAILQVNRRTRTTNTSGFIYSYISNSVFAAGITTVTVVNDSGTLDAGLSLVAYGLLSATNSAIPLIQTAGIADDAVTLAKLQNIATDSFLGRDTAGTGSPEVLTVNQAATLIPMRDPIAPIDGTVASNALTVTINPMMLDFRDSSLTSGTVNTRTIGSAITVVVPSGATLGTVNAVQALLAVLAIDNAGTVEAAVVNLAGGFNISESGLISTTTIGTGSDSASVAYSTTGRSNVPYRVVGFLEATEATAGTWATAPSVKQGAGGNAIASINSGRAWATVTGSRAASTTYYNTARHDKEVRISSNAAVSIQFNFLVDGVGRDTQAYSGAGNGIVTVGCTIPPGSSYSLTVVAGTVNVWSELG